MLMSQREERRGVMKEKWTDRRGGVNRLIAIMLALVGVMLIIIAVPAWRRFRENAAKIGCSLALDKAQDTMAVEYLFNNWSMSVQEAAAIVDRSRYERDKLCPGGGDYFILRESGGIGYKVVCGLHDDDARERTRLCSGAAMSRLLKELENLDAEPENITVPLNGKELVCERVDADPGLMFGTKFDIERKGIVCYYALTGDAESRKAVEQAERIDLSALPDGALWYFGYADESHASVWTYSKGWSGDAWSAR